MAKMALGKGLSALIAAHPAPAPGMAAVDDAEKIRRVSLDSISPSPLQPRKDFGADALSELVESIRQHGIIQPLIVRTIDGRHELIAVGHAKVLLALKAPEEQLAVAETVLRRSATVRATERLVAGQLGQAKPRHRRPSSVSVNANAIEHLRSRLQEHLGTRVVLHHGEKQGRIEIEYYGADDLQRIMQLIGLPPEN